MILLVDDEPHMMEYCKAVLEGIGVKVDGYTNAGEALEQYEKNPDKYTKAILDVYMPRLSGEDLQERFHKINPNLPVMFLTGLSDKWNVSRLKKKGQYIKKDLSKVEAVQKMINFAL